MACKNTCLKYKAVNTDCKNARYANGQKRCPVCETFLIWDLSNNCPCCGHKLRLKPKNARLKMQYNNILTLNQNQKSHRQQKLSKDHLTSPFYQI